MKTGAGITRTLAFAASLMGGSSTQSGSCDESASKKLKITGTTYLTTTDFTTSTKVDVDKTLFEKDAGTKEEDVEKKRAKEEKKEADWVEANPLYNAKANKEAREGMQKQIEEADLVGGELKEAQWAAVQKQKEERKKDEEHRLLLQLNTEQWGSLDADVKANLVDFYYYEEEERFTVWGEVEKKRVKEAKKEAKKEERKRAKDAKAVERAEKGKAALEITKSQGKSTGVSWNKSHCKWVATFHRRGMTPRHLGCFSDRVGAVAAHSSYSSSQ
jgi:hypothetical protein